MAKFKNTAPGGRGIGVGGKSYEAAAGAVIDIPDAVVKAAQEDPANAGMFGEGGFVPVSAEVKAAEPAKTEPKKTDPK